MSVSAGKPDWIRVRAPGGEKYAFLRDTLRRLDLHTVCAEARCPNVGDCWSKGAATVMVLGDVCTRGCRFCAVTSGHPGGVYDEQEPERVALAIKEVGLNYVVLTMVTRDDLPDGGAARVADTVTRIRACSSSVLVETLVSDFGGNSISIDTIVERARPDVYAHNVEVVPRLQSSMRDVRCSWERSLQTLRRAGQAGAKLTKSSLMVGCGETDQEVFDAMGKLRDAGVDILTIGQYLRPTARHAPVERYVTPERFDDYREAGLQMGFKHVTSGPLVRSSYRAAEAYLHAMHNRLTNTPANRAGSERPAEVVE